MKQKFHLTPVLFGFWVGVSWSLWLSTAFAGLKFEQATLTKEAGLGDEVVTYEFKFRATGNQPTHITEIRGLCDCLQIGSDRKTYQPGEGGVITAKLTLGSLEGRVSKSFNITTDDARQGRLLLTCVANVSIPIEFSNAVFRWRVSDPPVAKVITMRVLGDERFQITKIEATGSNMKPSWKEVEGGRLFELTLHPVSTAKPEAGMVKIHTSSPMKKLSARFLYFSIRPGRP